MRKIVNIREAIGIAKKLRNKNKTIAVAGGFFDILHKGHIEFLKNAKKLADFLFILLEDDEKLKKVKGPNRPINSQKNRALILSSLPSVDYVVLLKKMTNDNLYDRIINQLAPSVLVTTYPDPGIKHKIRQAEQINAKVKYAIKRISKYSTTKLEKFI